MDPSHELLGCAMSFVIDEEGGSENGGEEMRGVDERPPVTLERCAAAVGRRRSPTASGCEVSPGLAEEIDRCGGAKEAEGDAQKAKEEEDVCGGPPRCPPTPYLKRRESRWRGERGQRRGINCAHNPHYTGRYQ
jgi:hypothetical protein